MLLHAMQSFHVLILLPSAMKLRRLCFYKCVSVHRGECLTRYTPQDQVHPPNQVHPQDQVHPQTRYTPWYIPPGQVHPPDQVHPLDQVHPPTRCSPSTRSPPDQVHPPEIRPLLRTVRILLECILSYKRSHVRHFRNMACVSKMSQGNFEPLPTGNRQSPADRRLRRPMPQYSWATRSSCSPFTAVM